MYHAHQTYLAGPDCESKEIDVMDFIHSEIYHAILEKKTPVYAPYIMKLILIKVKGLNTRGFTKHRPKKLQILTHEDAPRGSRVPFADDEDMDPAP